MNIRESYATLPARNVREAFVALREGSPDQPRDDDGKWTSGGGSGGGDSSEPRDDARDGADAAKSSGGGNELPPERREAGKKFSDPKQNPYHKTISKYGFAPTSTTMKANRFAKDNPKGDHPIYQTPQKSRGYTGKVSPVSADYHTAGRMMRQRMPAQDKGGHLAAGDDLAQTARQMDVDHAALTKRALAGLKRKGIDPGPLISGVVSGRFSDKTKNELRRLAHGSSASKSAAMAHFAAARKKIDTARQRLNKEKYAGWDKTTRQPKFS